MERKRCSCSCSCSQLLEIFPHIRGTPPPAGGGALPYMTPIGICRCEGYGLKQFSLGQGIEIREFWSGIGYHWPGN